MRRRAEQGFALLIVLWTLALLSFLVAQMLAAAHSEAEIAANLRSKIVLEEAADGALYATIFHLLDRSDAHWEPDGAPHALAAPGAEVSVRITDEANKVNLNTASLDLLRALLLGVGADTTTADRLAPAIVEWRADEPDAAAAARASRYRAAGLAYAPPGQPFRSIDELALVLGATPDLLARLRPHLTLYSTYGPGRASTDPVAAAAIMLLRIKGGVLPYEANPGNQRVVRVVATASSAAGAVFTRGAVLRLDPASKERPYAILEWDE